MSARALATGLLINNNSQYFLPIDDRYQTSPTLIRVQAAAMRVKRSTTRPTSKAHLSLP
jgi:hypothetical protein